MRWTFRHILCGLCAYKVMGLSPPGFSSDCVCLGDLHSIVGHIENIDNRDYFYYYSFGHLISVLYCKCIYYYVAELHVCNRVS